MTVLERIFEQIMSDTMLIFRAACIILFSMEILLL